MSSLQKFLVVAAAAMLGATACSTPERLPAVRESAVWGDIQETSDTLRSHMYLLRRALTATGAATGPVPALPSAATPAKPFTWAR